MNFGREHLESMARVIGMKEFETNSPQQPVGQTVPEEKAYLPNDTSKQVESDSAEPQMSLGRRLAMGAAVGIVGTAVSANLLAPEVADSASEVEAQPIISITGEAIIGGEDTGWDHGAAERAIKDALNDNKARMDAEHIDIDMLSYYDAATRAVEIAREDGDVSQKDDLIKIYLDVVKKKTDEKASIEITNAEIIETPADQ